jgi:hypothetical protein
MKMVVMAPPGAQLGKPGTIIVHGEAKLLLDGGVYENAVNLRKGCGSPQ